jgi:hypothetical protein
MQARPISRSPQSLGSRCRRLGSGGSGSSSTDLRGSMMKLVPERHARSPMSRSRGWLSKSWSRYRRMQPAGARERWPMRLDSRNGDCSDLARVRAETTSDRSIQTVDKSTIHRKSPGYRGALVRPTRPGDCPVSRREESDPGSRPHTTGPRSWNRLHRKTHT